MYQIVNYYQENNEKILDYRLQSRYLWDDHISYTRNAIVSILSSLSDTDAIVKRLLKNQEDIGTFISPYYNDLQVNTFVDLLKKHIMLAGEVIEGVEESEEDWRMNGVDIVNYMHEMNPMFWQTAIIGPLWSKHLDMTIEQINARNNSMWDADIIAYDANHVCMNEFADLFAKGIIYQNINMFCLYMTGVQYG